MAERHFTCPQCGVEFSYKIGRGTDRKYCGDSCSKAAALARTSSRKYSECAVAGCGKPANRVGAGLCDMHYGRVRRNGTLNNIDLAAEGPLVHSGGYLLDYAPDHPLRRASPRVYQHRVVFYDAHGEGPFQCHCCGKEVSWDGMHVDHLNDDVTDNRLENLAPACPRCNQKRGEHKMARTTKRVRGKHLTAHGVTMCISDWARHLGVTRAAIHDRLARGALAGDALTPRFGRSGPESGRARVPLRSLLVLADERADRSSEWVI